MIRFDTVTKRYPGGQDALKEVSFSVDEGEMVFLTGHSGAGKSSVLKLLSVQERPTRGSVLVGGRNVGAVRAAQVPSVRRRIGQVFQDHRLLMDRTVFDNVALPLVIAGTPRAELERRVRSALDLVGLGGRERAQPLQLSAGEQQRVGIARAIAPRPPLVIADEPTGNLDPKLAGEVMGLFIALAQGGITVLVASHDLHLVSRLRKRVLVLDHGRLIDDFRPAPKASVA
ncbi:MAG: cell division ATP-binding protein FtsE [Pseudomonadota bacterium]|jgi:cell division transport system ATP-binding protein